MLLPTAVAFALAAQARQEDWANLLLTIAVLAVAVAALEATTVSPAELVVQRQEELGLTDILFMGDPPRDFLIQLHVAVANVGGRKGVLSTLTLEESLAARGERVQPYLVPRPLRAQKMTQSEMRTFGTADQARQIRIETTGLPLVIEPDDVITLRFRCRRGIDWREHWTLDEIRKLAVSIADPIARAKLKAVYRRGDRVVTSWFEVPLVVAGHAEYVARLQQLTNDYTLRPEIPPQPFELE